MTEMVVRSLNEVERGALETALALASRLSASDTALTVAHVQALYDAAVEKGASDDVVIAIGLAFGALFVDGKEFEWARIEDQWGSETCVAVVGRMSQCAPISMIQKRLGRGERVDLSDMKEGVMDALRKNAAQAAAR